MQADASRGLSPWVYMCGPPPMMEAIVKTLIATPGEVIATLKRNVEEAKVESKGAR